MVELISQEPCAGLLPLEIGTCRLEGTRLACLTSIAPFAGQSKALSQSLSRTHGVDLPAPNRTSAGEAARLIWFGREIFLLVGPEPDGELASHAALTDQTDAWAAVSLSGPAAVDVLARLVPVDLRLSQFEIGHTARTLLGHMTVSITRVDAGTLLILCFRSMAQTLIHEMKLAMEAVAARG